MPDKYLYELLIEEFGKRTLGQIELPKSLTDNLAPKYELRPYQVDAFQRFICYFEKEFEFKKFPSHLLFNMATGSGKTLIMAGLIPYLYEKGYRNFLFFVNSTNIIEKTKDNFLNPSSIKYLFKPDLVIDDRRIKISLVDNFEGASASDINICFTTIQKLHSDLTTIKENAITYEDFRKYKVVLIADEAHHMNVTTRARGELELFESWENTVERILIKNDDNLLLEFTATHDYETPAMVKKYRDKVIIRYDLPQFRNDKYSKDVTLAYSGFGLSERIIQSLIISQYKQEVAAKNHINLKPVVLFKAQKTILQSKENKSNFHQLIRELSVKDIDKIRRESDLDVVGRAFGFFDSQGITSAQLVERLKHEFQEDFCLSVNDENEKINYQVLVNTLEDKKNRIRAIFAVQKLNEGWDVLNLFDIVRCYETRDSGGKKIGPTTTSEAQLIGRGARYFPFVLPDSNDRYRRKFDGDLEHELRVLEELHYHSINNPKYIFEIKTALIQQGVMDKEVIKRELELKDTFKKTALYKKGVIWLNSRLPKSYERVRSISDFGVKRKNYVHMIASGHGGTQAVLANGEKSKIATDEKREDVKIKEIEKNIVQAALARNPFFTFSNLNKYFPRLTSVRDFISLDEYLGGLEITFQGNLDGLPDNRVEKLAAVQGLLGQIEAEIRANITDFEGTREFHSNLIHEVFTDKLMMFDSGNPRGAEDSQFEHFVSGKGWFAFTTIFGTSEEKAFVRMLDRHMKDLQSDYEQIFLLRNEGHFALYNFGDGRAFQPDFVLFLLQKDGKTKAYQLFIEPKGKHLGEKDRWKEEFLASIKTEFLGKTLDFDGKQYRLIGVPFYNNEDENLFRESLQEALQIQA